MRAAAAALGAAVLVGVSACTGTPGQSARPSPTPSTAQTPSPSPVPVVLDPRPARLEWSTVADTRADSVIVTDWGEVGTTDKRVNVPPGRGPDHEAGPGFRFSDTLVDGPYLVTVAEDDAETKPSLVRIHDLRTGTIRRFGAPRAPAVAAVGSWAVGLGQLAYATYQGRRYCLALADLATGRGKVVHCAARRTGLNGFHLSDAA